MVESKSSNFPDGLSLATFSDGHDDGIKPDIDFDHYMAELQCRGSETLRDLIVSSLERGQKFMCVFYTVLIPWVADVAKSLQIPTTLVWIQPATVFDIYYYYFNGYEDEIRNAVDDPSSQIQLPGLPVLNGRDIPSFFSPASPYSFSLPLLRRHFEILNEETNPKVLVNTYDALEPNAVRAINRLDIQAIGLLVPSAFLDGQDPSDTSFGGDLFQSSKDYIKWLKTKPNGSVVYVSFGSISVLSKLQKEEMARGLLESGRPFLWVIRNIGNEENDEDRLSCMDDLRKKGMIVPWCSQVEVLSQASVGCFVTHCGWNSTLESLVSGVPMVAFPQWTDQHTNAKLIKDVWTTGVRVNMNKDGVVEGEEIKRCLELVLGDGERGEEMRRNAKKWREMAIDAAREGGSSDQNLRSFMDEIRRLSFATI
ncbi:hypothetical protein CDL15_Pgr004947 [Punica granatum]|nr:hypothetical protein CDL15_Pgr004943 [Punica granatum]OWM76732.1 hypothetical protein CDL15_Pgr004944 [Punica granatum]OWM76735.1 hypothetical protein CDL15_Pgr004947 [Punica granatum]